MKKKSILKIKSFVWILKQSFKEFRADSVTKLSASLSYFTIFSLPPLILLLISVFSSVLSRETVENQVFSTIGSLLGDTGANDVKQMIANINQHDNTLISTIVALVTLFLGATGVFSEMQSSINTIWSIKAKPKKKFVKYMLTRLLSFSMIVTVGFLLLVSLVVNTLLALLSDKLSEILPMSEYIVIIISNIISILIIGLLFAMIFKILPDAKIPWKYAIRGAVFTSILFMVGKVLIGLYLGNSNIGTTYGAAGSVILLLAWIYYTSLILYFGAEFTKVYMHANKATIQPNSYAVLTTHTEAVSKSQEIQLAEKKV